MTETELDPTLDPHSPTGVYIPSDLQDCFRELNRALPVGMIDDIRTGGEGGLSLPHFGLGMWMRNNWGLWNMESRLIKYCASIGFGDADDASSMIIESYWRHLNGRPIDIPRQNVYNKIDRYEIENGPKTGNLS